MFPLETIVARAKRRWFVYPWSDIYGGLANAWDYGPYGSQLKKNIEDLRRKTFVEERADMIGMDSQILMHPKVREASGHVAGFNDPLIDDKKTGERFRADKIIEERIEILIIEKWIGKDISGLNANKAKIEEEKAKLTESTNLYLKKIKEDKKENDDSMVETLTESLRNAKTPEEQNAYLEIYNTSRSNIEKIADQAQIEFFDMYRDYFIKLAKIEEEIDREIRSIITKLGLVYLWINNLVPESWTLEQMKAFIVKEIPNNPNTQKPADRTDVRKFAMMFYTYQGVIHNEDNKIRMRPETAQGIFVNFKNVLDTTRMRIPFGIAQVGKAFRNEITPGNFLYRVREFEQMEIEYFVENDKEKAWAAFDSRKQECMKRRVELMQLRDENVRFRAHESDELSHYSAWTFDVEFKFPRGWGELQGIAYRTDFDLTQHQAHSGKDLQYTDPYTGKRYIPHVIEPSFGLTRTVLAMMLDCYDEESYTDGNGEQQTRTVARFPKHLAPVKFAILPLLKKDDRQVAFAEELFRSMSKKRSCEYDDGGAIGKRYRRQDEIGTPYCITIDHQTAEDGTVTLRDRDTMEQIRVRPEDITL